jgi:predicted nuclease of restriction endonuclease-like (RecB) superfamily
LRTAAPKTSAGSASNVFDPVGRPPLAREFYAEMCRIERWDVRTFREKIGSMLFQRTVLSKNTKAVISSGIAQLA